MGVDVDIVLPSHALEKVKTIKPSGIILSGGPSSVYIEKGLLVDKEIFEKNIPILGICYGLQIMAHLLGGKVNPGKKKEYGPTNFNLYGQSKLFKDYPKKCTVWMSHFDEVISPPKGGEVVGSTDTIKVAAFSDDTKKLYGIQFHPEVHHTEKGIQILRNFVLDICHEKETSHVHDVDAMVREIKTVIGEGKAVCALSGGIDSAVAAVLTHKAIGDNLTCFYVDTGMMRLGETAGIEKIFKENFKLNLKTIYAEDEFLQALKGVTDPETKRKIIGELFIRIFEREAKKLGAVFLIQGTIYPDVIESKGTEHAQVIKTHHNVGGLPEKHGFKLVEPLRELYKDEVREIAKSLGFPKEMVRRHVFPGPGLAVRLIGEITKEKLDILRKADAIVVDEIKKAGLYDDIWMAFAVFTGVKSTGVAGDERKYGETIAVRVIESKDTMTADWVRLPYDVLAAISNRIVTEVFEVTRVVYDITTKPPATMEWE
jgi:GMP synthase (glutamine-hydrolysing)